MPRYINADKIEEIFYTMSMCSSSEYCKAFNEGVARMFAEIVAAPTADVVEVVRCKDCKSCELGSAEGFSGGWCDMHVHHVDDNDYCSYGERKESHNA